MELKSMSTVIVNTFAKNKSTGKIAYGFFKYLKEKNIDVFLAYGQPPVYEDEKFYRIGNAFWSKIHIFLSRVFGNPGCYSTIPTLKFIRKLKKIKPETVYLFNIHGYYLNEYIFLNYLKKQNIRTIYVMLDEYAFMGKCGFSLDCNEYLTGCKNCRFKSRYPASWFINSSHKMAEKKKKVYDNFFNLVFVAIPYTLELASKSYLLSGKKLFPADEAIDIKMYYPRKVDKLKKRLGVNPTNKVIVCIAVYPDERKGGQYFFEAAKKLSSDNRITFVHVGFSGDTSKCPPNYIPISYVENQEELCEYYSLADLFCFPSLCETLPSTCLEALACGSPLLLFNISGMPYIADETCSQLVKPRDVDALVDAFKKVEKKDDNVISCCRNYAEKKYDNRLYYNKLMSLM